MKKAPAQTTVYDEEKALRQMTKFIWQEAYEKADEIDVKTEEEFNMQKAELVQDGRLKISREFDKMEKNTLNAEAVKIALLTKEFRLSESTVKHKHLSMIRAEVRERVIDEMKNERKHTDVLNLLCLEGIYKLLESHVEIRCRKSERNVIETLIPNLERLYFNKTKQRTRLSLDSVALDKDLVGGVMMYCKKDKIMLNNTLDSRIEQTITSCIPVMCHIFYGSSKFSTSQGQKVSISDSDGKSGKKRRSRSGGCHSCSSLENITGSDSDSDIDTAATCGAFRTQPKPGSSDGCRSRPKSK